MFTFGTARIVQNDSTSGRELETVGQEAEHDIVGRNREIHRCDFGSHREVEMMLVVDDIFYQDSQVLYESRTQNNVKPGGLQHTLMRQLIRVVVRRMQQEYVQRAFEGGMTCASGVL